MNIDPYAWTDGGIEKTKYPAQVHIRVRLECHPLSESQFRGILSKNYYSPTKFYFKLDHAQVDSLISLFKKSATTKTTPPTIFPRNTWLQINGLMNNVSHDDKVSRELAEINSLATSSFSMVQETKELSCAHVQRSTLCESDSAKSLPEYDSFAGGAVKYESTSTGSPSQQKQIIENQLNGRAEEREILNKLKQLVNSHFSPSTNSLKNEDGEFSIVSCAQRSTLCESDSAKSLPEYDSFAGGAVKYESTSTGSPSQQKQIVENKLNGRTEERETLNKLKQLVNSHFSPSTNSLKNEDGEFSSEGISQQEHACTQSKEFLEKPKDGLLGFEYERSLTQLKEDIEILRSMSLDQGRQITILEEKEVQSQAEILKLKMQVKELESQLVMTTEAVDHLPEDVPDDTTTSYIEEAIYLVGGYNGTSWLSTLDLYAPTCGSVLSLPSMSSPRSYAGVVSSHGCIYAIGGGDGCSWYDTVEFYNPSNKEWSRCSPLSCEKGSLAAASLKDKLFVLGGSNGIDSFSDVEMYDPVLGKWILVGSMLHERFSHAAVELGGAVYVVGGYDGKEYLRSTERYDHREASWTRLESMSSRRGCPSLVVLNEKLYALGGYDGRSFLSSVEMFDPRIGSWIFADPMNSCRGYAAAVTLGDSVHIMGGFIDDGQDISDTAECYREGAGWQITGSKALGRRCLHTAAVL
ncbi:uncharacterized protein LOC116255182 isoform X2 [Nymphaea colorata]|nr:uncharacterized protein LOC116255182 isoform X2 [Nymphaea colorata]